MKSTVELLDIARAQNGGCSDYRLAQLLGVRPNYIANWRSGRNLPANPTAARLAELCGLDPAQVVCWVNMERATSLDDVEMWKFLLSRVKPTRGARLAA